ncbi:MAG: prolipoprotein diacylglyceryl transferase, partial [Clostridia bacterium]|nr:prolipoprotein diacylglyceryl transferase [Clostridia bacterium]
ISVMNEYGEWQLAVFLMEAAAAVVILMIALREKQGRGERIMTALLLYAVCQVVFESLRMDGCLKLGFVRISQVISAVVILAVTVIRAQRCGGRKAAFARGAIVLACVAVVGVIEWALDKTPMSNLILYALMIAACAVFAVNGTRMKKE